METTSYQPAHDLRVVLPLPEAASNDWRNGLPVLCGSRVLLRELRMSDASALFARLTAEAVSQFISRPPSTVEGFERFIDWTWRQRTAGTYACFAVTVDRDDAAVGIIQVRRLESDFSRAEWGFAIGSEYWGTGAFKESAELVLGFAFDVLGVHRLEARAVLRNGRGNGALRKLGAVQEGVLRKSFCRNGEALDQALWTILGDEWRGRTVGRRHRVH